MTQNQQASSFSVSEIMENAGIIRMANQSNDQNMENLFQDLVTKTEEYRNRLQVSEAKVDTMKTVIAKQWHEINALHRKLGEVTKKLHIAESTAQINATKYNRIYGKLKGIILESACESAAADGEGNV